MGKVLCEACHKKCSGNVLRVGKQYFHVACFKCRECQSSLSQGGFFSHMMAEATNYYCAKCYQDSFGTKCSACNNFVEGEVVTALGNTYHQQCFRCSRCNQPFPTGEKVTWTGKECICQKCVNIPIVSAQPVADGTLSTCNACHDQIADGQALIALDNHWHVWCFKCETCGEILHGEYLNKDGKVYCEKDYQKQFGIKCHHCTRYITGKVLQAGENHFHPTCARCSKCGDVFNDGEEMYIQGAAIWHPRCGPGPGQKIDDDTQFPPSQRSRTASPSVASTLSRSISPFGPVNGQFSRSSSYLEREPHLLTYSYLTAEPTQGYLRRPIEPRPSKSPQFHRPPEQGGGSELRRRTPTRASKQGMRVLVDQLRSTTPRPKSPSMNNEEPIELAHYPDAHKPKPDEVPRIERDDFPAPPCPYTDPEKIKRYYDSKGDLIEELDEVDAEYIDPQLKKEEEELTKISTGIGKVFLKTVKEREKVRAYRRANIDPRNASRTPSAKTEIPVKLRYENPVNASPSRDMDRPKPWEDEEYSPGTFYRNYNITRSQPYINYNMVSSLRHIPKPGYGLKYMTAPQAESSVSPYPDNRSLPKTQSIDFSSGKSDISTLSDQNDKNLRQYMNHSASGTFRTTPFSDGFNAYRYSSSRSLQFNRSMPNVNFHHQHNEPAREYPYHLLTTNNYRLPPDVDRCHLERHLQNSEFEYLFGISRMDFYRLPEWRRNELKRRVKLF